MTLANIAFSDCLCIDGQESILAIFTRGAGEQSGQESIDWAGEYTRGAGESSKKTYVGQESTYGAGEHLFVGQESRADIYIYIVALEVKFQFASVD